MTLLHDDPRSMLARVIQPLDEPTFLRDHWARRPVVFTSNDAGRFDGLFDLNDLEQYLFIARPAAGEIQIIRNGEWAPVRRVAGLFPGSPYDLQAVHSTLAEGFTVVLNVLHARWPAARRLVDGIEDRLLARAQTNVYVTGPRGQGFAVHTDDHDVFVLQTCGTKRWLIYDKPTASAPMGSTPPLFDLELRRGDALYLPIGYPHAAETAGDVSIHVSLGVFPLTWQAFAHQCVNALAQHDSSWSEPLPIARILSDDPLPASEMTERMTRGLAAMGDLATVLQHYRRDLGASARRMNPPPSGYTASLQHLEDLRVDDEVERRPGVGCVVTNQGAKVAMHFMGETILAPVGAAGALRFIASTSRFTVAEIDATLSDASKIVLVRRLMREGLLQMAAPRTSA